MLRFSQEWPKAITGKPDALLCRRMPLVPAAASSSLLPRITLYQACPTANSEGNCETMRRSGPMSRVCVAMRRGAKDAGRGRFTLTHIRSSSLLIHGTLAFPRTPAVPLRSSYSFSWPCSPVPAQRHGISTPTILSRSSRDTCNIDHALITQERGEKLQLVQRGDRWCNRVDSATE
ncbi:uncharacterized protein LOC144472971 [Augochlora pura]